jgi:hypothetical protein
MFRPKKQRQRSGHAVHVCQCPNNREAGWSLEAFTCDVC